MEDVYLLNVQERYSVRYCTSALNTYMVMVVLACDPTFYDTLVPSCTSICNGLGIRLLHLCIGRSNTCSLKKFKMDYSVTKTEIPFPRSLASFSDSHSLSTYSGNVATGTSPCS